MSSILGSRPAVASAAGKDVVLPAFEAYQQARAEFAHEVARLALPNGSDQSAAAPGGTYEVDGPEKVVSALEGSYHLIAEMRPLTIDQSPAVRENALIAMGRLSNVSKKLQGGIVAEDTLAAAIDTISATAVSPSLLKAALFMLHSALRDSAEAANVAVERNALPALCDRLEDADSGTKAAAVWCLAAIAHHDASLAAAVADSGAIASLMQCLKEPSLPLRRVTLACLGSIGKHEHSLADVLQKEGVISHAVGLLGHKDYLLRRQACRLLSCAIQHQDGSIDWVPSAARKLVIETLRETVETDGETGAFAATLLQQIAKRSTSAATQMYEAGAVPLLVVHLAARAGSPTPAAGALGHICDAASDAARAAIDAGALDALHTLLASMPPPPICAFLCACLGAIANAGDASASAVASSGCLRLMADATVLSSRKMGPATTALARKSIAKAMARCADYGELVGLLESLPMNVPKAAEKESFPHDSLLAALMKALSRLLSPSSPKGSLRLDFMQRGALTLCQDAKASASAELREALKALNATFPKQMIAATDPHYEKNLLAQIK